MSLEKIKFICALYQEEIGKIWFRVFNPLEVLKYIAATLQEDATLTLTLITRYVNGPLRKNEEKYLRSC